MEGGRRWRRQVGSRRQWGSARAERAERVSGAGLRAGRGASPEGEEGRACDRAWPSADGKEELGCGSVGPGGEEGVMRWAAGLGWSGPPGCGLGWVGVGRRVGFGFSSFFLLSYFLCFSVSNTNQTKPI